MFTTKKLLLSVSSLALSLGILSNTLVHAESPTKDVVVAVVNGDEIVKSTLDGYLAVLAKQKPGKVDRAAALDDLVATELALQEAGKTDILDRPDIKKSIRDYTRNVLLQTWTKDKVDSFDISDADIKKAYDESVTQLSSKEFNARHILVKTEDEAKAIIKEAMSDGADFAEIAKEKSTGPSGSNGGSLGWFKAETMVPAFSNAVKTMSKGDISKTPVKTQFGFHVIKLEDSRDAKLPTLESLKPRLERGLSQKKMLAFMEDLKAKASIKLSLPAEATMEEKKDEGHDHKDDTKTN